MEIQKKSHPKITIIGGLIILTIAGILGILTLSIFLEVNQERSYNLHKLAMPYNLTMTKTISEIDVQTATEERLFEIDVVLTTTSLSVNNPIHVKALFNFPDLTEEQWKQNPEFIILVFPQAYDDPDSENLEASGGAVKMKKDPNSRNYYGDSTIMYPFEGDYGYTILPLEDAYEVSSEKHEEEGIITINYRALGLNEKVDKDTLFHIDSSPSNLKINQIGQALTYVIIAIGSLQLRKEFIKGCVWIYEKLSH